MAEYIKSTLFKSKIIDMFFTCLRQELKRSAADLPTEMVPKRKSGSGAPKKISPRTDNLLKREVTSNPSITAVGLKSKHPELLHNVSTRTIRHRLQKDLGLPCRRAAKKPMLTAAMRKNE